MLTFNHFNFNVTDLDASLRFYKDALGLEPVRRKEAEDGSFVLVFLGDGKTGFQLELTWLRDHPQKYDLGECEFHLALQAEDFAAAHARHEAMGCICFENPKMGIYFREWVGTAAESLRRFSIFCGFTLKFGKRTAKISEYIEMSGKPAEGTKHAEK